MCRYDCIVAGAGASGFAAAVGAAQAGAKVLLVDRMPAAGGSAVYTMTPVLSGWRNDSWGKAVGSMLAEKLQKYGACDWRVCRLVTSEDYLQKAMMEILEDFYVDTLFNATLCGVSCSDDRIEKISVMTSGGIREYSAANFVDATGDAVLSRLAGAEIIIPDDSESMTKTLMFKVRNVHGYDRDEVKALFKEHIGDFPVKIQDSFMGLPLLCEEEMVLNLTAVTGNAADPEALSRMYKELCDQVGPIMDFLRRYIPCFADAVVTKLAPGVGVRYTCSVRGLRTLSMDDMHNPQMPPEPIAGCGSYIGGHFIKGYSSPWGKEITGNPAVPYGAIRAAGLKNLLTAGRIIDVDPRAVTAIRLVAQCLATGQAAGIAAALNVPEYDVLFRELERQGCVDWMK